MDWNQRPTNVETSTSEIEQKQKWVIQPYKNGLNLD